MVVDIVLEVTTRGDELVVTKTALTPEAAERLDRERQRAEAARHPGVVELVAVGREPASLTYAWAGGRSLESALVPPDRAVPIVAKVARTLADLHDRGIVHGRLEPSHVVVGIDDHPRLCGLAGPEPEEPEPAPEDDVAGLGTILATLAGGSDAEPIPDHRWRRRRWDGYVRAAMQTLADQATDPDTSHRPTARALARSLDELVPAGDAAPEPAHARAMPVRAQMPGARWAVVGVGAVAVLGVALVAMRTRPAAEAEVAAGKAAMPAAGVGTTTSTTIGGPTSTVTPPAPPASTAPCPSVDGLRADVDGDGCVDPVSIDRGEVEADGVRYRIGERDDRVAVGDWDCDGKATPALLRPSTGEVFVFRSWAPEGKGISVRPSATVKGANALLAPDGDRCGPVRVRRADGSVAVVPAGSER